MPCGQSANAPGLAGARWHSGPCASNADLTLPSWRAVTNAALSAVTVKTDRRHARGTGPAHAPSSCAQCMPMGWFRTRTRRSLNSLRKVHRAAYLFSRPRRGMPGCSIGRMGSLLAAPLARDGDREPIAVEERGTKLEHRAEGALPHRGWRPASSSIATPVKAGPA